MGFLLVTLLTSDISLTGDWIDAEGSLRKSSTGVNLAV